MNTKYPAAPIHDERLYITLPAPLKRQVFENAAVRGVPAAIVIREALSAFVNQQAA